MSVAEITNILIAIGTFAAAVAALLTARTSARQVRFQFEPRLRISNRFYQIRVHKDVLQEIWWSPPTEDARIINGGSINYTFCVENIGAGAASDITIITKYDYTKIFSAIYRKLEENNPDLEFSMDNWGMVIKKDRQVLGGFRVPDECISHIDYLPPAGRKKSSENFGIDPSLAFFFLVYAHDAQLSAVDNDRTSMETETQVSFEVRFKDQSGSSRRSEYRAVLELSGGRSKSDRTDGVALVRLKILDS